MESDKSEHVVHTLFDSARANREWATKVYELLGLTFSEETEKTAERTNLHRLQGIMEETKGLLEEAAVALATLGEN